MIKSTYTGTIYHASNPDVAGWVTDDDPFDNGGGYVQVTFETPVNLDNASSRKNERVWVCVCETLYTSSNDARNASNEQERVS